MRIGINGLGRIGRGFLKTVWDNPRLQVTALNDVAEGAVLAHLLRHDSYYGPWNIPVAAVSEGISVGGRTMPLYHCASPSDIPWEEWGVEWVVEATGKFKSRRAMEGHRCNVLLTASSQEADRQVVYGVNHESIRPEEVLLSATSCTTHCVVPPLWVLHQRFSARSVLFNTVHCYNVGQTLVDAPQKDLRRARAGALNMIPTTTSASLALEAVLPDLKGRIRGMAVRVPAPAVSLTEITLQVERAASPEAVTDCLQEAADGGLKGILALSWEELVSQDFLASTASSTVDLPLLQVQGDLVRLIAWYDNEWGYVHRLVDLLAYLEGRQT